jgi:hypothetical protein
MLFELPYYDLILEVDEKNHIGYTEEEEIRHLQTIHKHLCEKYTDPGRRLVVFRLNPDGKHPLFRCAFRGALTGADPNSNVPKREPLWEPTAHFEAEMPRYTRRVQELIEEGINGRGTFPRGLVEGVYVEKFEREGLEDQYDTSAMAGRRKRARNDE